jgi:hypothetical protein
MLAQEMHLEIDLELQKLNSQFNKNILPEEKDWFLNNEVRKFIKHRLDPTSNARQTGFEDTAKRLDDLRELVKVENKPILTDDRGRKYVVLPSNYFQYVRVDSFSFRSCVTPAPTQVAETNYIATVDMRIPSILPSVYNIIANTPSGAKTLFTITDLPTGYLQGTNIASQRFALIRAIRIKLEEAVKEQFTSIPDLYWEEVPNNGQLNKFRIESTEEITSIVINIDTTSTTTTISPLTTMRYSLASTPLRSNTRILDEEFYLDAVNSHLSSSTAESPISTIRGNRIEIDQHKSVVLGSADITYICKPVVIDLLLNSNLNMSTKSAKEITGNTTRFIKGLIQDNNYQTYARENILIE